MKRIILAFTLLFPSTLFSNEKMIDSLSIELGKAKGDTQIVRILDLLAFYSSRTNPEKGIEYSQRALKISNDLGWKKGMAMAYSGLGLNYHAKSEFQKSIGYHTRSLYLYRQLGNENAQAGVMSNLSNAFKSIARYADALNYGFKALEIYENLKEPNNEAIVSQNIGTIYLEQKKYSKAIEYYERSIRIYDQLNNRYGVAMTLGNIAIVESALGNDNRALNFHKKALEINRQLDKSYSIQKNLANMGIIYLKRNEYDSSLYNLREALQISRHFDDKESIAINSGNIGEVFYQMVTDGSTSLMDKKRKQHCDSAITYLETAVNLSREIDLNGPFIEFSKYLALAYNVNGDHRKAYSMLREHTLIKDSIFSQKNQVDISNLEAKRELDLKIKDNEILKSQIEIEKLRDETKKTQTIMAVIGLFLLAILVLIVINRMKRRIRNQSGVLSDIAYYQSHKVRAPIARILGLAHLFNIQNPHDPENAVLLSHIKRETEQLDDLIKGIVKKAAAKH